MSTSKGNDTRKRPQKYQNRTAFKNDLHDSSRRTKMLNTLQVSGVCKRCKDIIEWKIKYKKYKALTAPAKCIGCNEKCVKHAYHVMCGKCAAERNVCAKCNKTAEEASDTQVPEDKLDTNQEVNLQVLLKGLPERKRRSVIRFIKKQGQDEDLKMTPEIQAKIDEVMSGMKNVDLDDEDFRLSSEDERDNGSDLES